MAKDDGDPPDQNLLDETQRVPASRVQIRDFFRRRGLSKLEADRFAKFLDDCETALVPHRSRLKRRRKTPLDLPAPIELKALPSPHPDHPPLPAGAQGLPTSTKLTTFAVAQPGKGLVHFSQLSHTTGHDPWAPVRSACRWFVRPFVLKLVMVTIGGVMVHPLPLNEPKLLAPPSSGIDTSSIPTPPASSQKVRPRRSDPAKGRPNAFERLITDIFGP